MAAERWVSVLPQVFHLLLSGADRIVDDTSIERLLAWLENVCSTSDGLKMLLQQETGVLTFLSSEKLLDKKPCCIGVSFALRLCGILWSKEYNIKDSVSFIDLFAKSRENESVWDEAIVRYGYFNGLQSLTVSNEGQTWLQKHKDCLLTAAGCISDSSMFVASAARELIAKFIISSWSIKISEQDSDHSSEVKWLLELLQKKLVDTNQPSADSKHQRLISDHVVAVLDIVRILLNTNFEAGQEILCVSKLFVKCVTAAVEMADQNICMKLVDVVNGFQMIPRWQHTMDWDNLLSCVGEQQDQSAQNILLSIPLKWFSKGLVTHALDFIAGLSLPNNTASRCFSTAWSEILACLISAPLEALMETPFTSNCNGYSEADTPDIDSLVEDLVSLKQEDHNTDRIKRKIHKLLEPWMLSKKCQVAVLLQVLYTIKDIVTKDASSYSPRMEQWIECSLKILLHSAMVSSADQNTLAVDVKGNAKVIKTALSLVTTLLQQVLQHPNLTDSNKEQFFHVLNTAILIARSPRTDPTVITSTLECISVLFGQASFLLVSPSSSQDNPDVLSAYCQRIKEDLCYLIHLRLRDQRWEVKDSALEFVGCLVQLNSESFPDDVISPSMLSLVWESVDDSESYVRSSAWCCIGYLVCHNPRLWAKLKDKEHLTEFAVLQKMAHVLENESEAFPRRSVMDCLISWSRDQRPIVSEVLPKADQKSQILEPKFFSSTEPSELKHTDSETRSLFSDIVKFAFTDFDWEVKIRVLQLLETIIQIFSDSRKSTQDGELGTGSQSDSPLLSLVVDLGAALPLLEAVIDCDSLVCEKALKVISTLKDIDASVWEPNKTGSEFQPIRNENRSISSEEHLEKLEETNRPIVTVEKLEDVIKTFRVLSVESFRALLCRLDVSTLKALCTAGDINVQKDPAGFLEDIIVAARDHCDNLLDCY